MASKTTQNTQTPKNTPVRILDRRVEKIIVRKNGLELDLGHGDVHAYVAGKNLNGHDIVAGARILGSYRMTGKPDNRYAEIIEISKIVPADAAMIAAPRTAATEIPAPKTAALRTRQLRRRVDAIENLRHGDKVSFGYTDKLAYVPNKLHSGELKVGDTVVGLYQIRGEGDSAYAHVTEISEIIPARVPRTAEKTVEEIEQVMWLVTATSTLSSNNRFTAEMKNGSKVVVQAMGRCVMYAKSLAKTGAELVITGSRNDNVSGNADFFFDAVGVHKSQN